MSTLERGETEGNVIKIEKRKTWWEQMTYGELLEERRFFREEKKRCSTAKTYALKIDKRRMWSECYYIWDKLDEMIDACQFGIEMVEKEMIKRKNEGRDHE